MRPIFALLFLASAALAAGPEFPLTEDSKPQANVAKGTVVKETYTAKPGSVFPGTQREYQLYLPAGFDASKPAAFMVFQDGVLYQAPVAFDNLIAKKDMPPLVGIFIKPGVVPAANENSLPRFDRSFEYDSVTPRYSQFLIDEFLPAIEAKHKLTLSKDPNHAAISGSSSGGICAFMVGWHRPDRFRRVFTSVGTYVGIHGADQLPVWIRKHAPKPLRVFLQSGTHDGNGYCGDWWMANQTMERSLIWAGYEVNHAWGEGGHDQKHASQVFPEVLRWLWKDWQTNMEVKANAKGEGKWRGYEVVGAGEWKEVYAAPLLPAGKIIHAGEESPVHVHKLTSDAAGVVHGYEITQPTLIRMDGNKVTKVKLEFPPRFLAAIPGPAMKWTADEKGDHRLVLEPAVADPLLISHMASHPDAVVTRDGVVYVCAHRTLLEFPLKEGEVNAMSYIRTPGSLPWPPDAIAMCLSPDQTQIYMAHDGGSQISLLQRTPHGLDHGQIFGEMDGGVRAESLCVDTDGRLYAATELGIQVCDQAGRVNFILPTPEAANGICFGGKDLSELFIACWESGRVYRISTKAQGVVSGQQAPIKPAAPKL